MAADSKPLYTSNLTEQDIYNIFPSLRVDTRPPSAIWGLSESQKYEIPEDLNVVLDDSDLVYQPGSSPSSPTLINNRVDNILFSCLSAESDSLFVDDAQTILPVQFNKQLNHRVTYKNQSHILYGSCDYSIIYTDDPNDLNFNLSAETIPKTTLLIHETKHPDSASSYKSTCLANLGIIHSESKNAKEDDCTVYGVFTDSWVWGFWRIDHDSRVSMHVINWVDSPVEAYSLLRMVVRHAASSGSGSGSGSGLDDWEDVGKDTYPRCK